MAGFRGLSDIIKEQIAANKTVQEFPAATPEAAYFGTNTKFLTPNAERVTNAFRWGVSTWGIESIIGANFPEDLEIQE